jgi:aspartate carbamoyltransferase regulatory subunit
MNKRGLIGKILLILGIIILIAGIIIGVTAYQGYSVFKVIQTEQKSIELNAQEIALDLQSKKFGSQDCTKIDNIQNSAEKIKKETLGACKNPLINIIIKKVMESRPIPTPTGNVTLSCDNLDPIYNQMQSFIIPIKTICNNQTLMNQLSIVQ